MIHRPGNTVVKTVPVGTNPVGVAVSPDGTHVYVTANTVAVIARPGNTVVATVMGAGFGIAVTPDGTLAYVTNVGSNNVSVIATATNPALARGLRQVTPIRAKKRPPGVVGRRFQLVIKAQPVQLTIHN